MQHAFTTTGAPLAGPTATPGTDGRFEDVVREFEDELAFLVRLRMIAVVLVALGLAMLPFGATSTIGTVASVAGSILMSVWIRRTNPT